MVNALVKINDETNRVLNSVKAIHGLKDKGEAIEFVVERFCEASQEPQFKKSYVDEIKKAKKQKPITVHSFASRYGL